ncbi:hypothetical protein AB0M02_39465 [Actinoplanes sp. NPDC051861]|uniref:hypothetical protein n=1 Tax=Actinoplanes sp. NPDC051861 TaxID=3155170 RepID=UPI003432E66D
MSGVEVIAAALAAGALAGVTGAASAAVEDAYRDLRALLRRRLGGSAEVLEPEETSAEVWEARLEPVLTGVDEELTAAADRLLSLTSGNLNVANNYGVAAVTMTGNVTINNSIPPK